MTIPAVSFPAVSLGYWIRCLTLSITLCGERDQQVTVVRPSSLVQYVDWQTVAEVSCKCPGARGIYMIPQPQSVNGRGPGCLRSVSVWWSGTQYTDVTLSWHLVSCAGTIETAGRAGRSLFACPIVYLIGYHVYSWYSRQRNTTATPVTLSRHAP